MSDLTKEQLDRVRAVAMREVDAILAEMAAEEVKKAKWPQDSDVYIYQTSLDEIVDIIWTGNKIDSKRFSLGNCFRPEHRPYLERQIEAQKVRAELMRQPGRSNWTASQEPRWCFLARKGKIVPDWFSNDCTGSYAIAGAWFESQEAIEAAAEVVGLDRIKLYFDWYIDTDIEGCPR